jgi:putative ABC transport system permease protein
MFGVLLAAAGVLTLVASVAPARRAMRLAPIEALAVE